MADWKRASKRRKAAIFDMLGIPHNIQARAKPAERRDLEGPVLRACKDLLAIHPQVLFCCRQNSGAASYEHSSGRYKPLWFYEWVRSPAPITLPDLWGMLYSGRMFFFEVKRPDWTKPGDDRERRQAVFLEIVRQRGAIGEFITDAEKIHALLA